MNRSLEVLLTVMALVGLFSGISASAPSAINSQVRAQNAVVVADGTDPMPLCRHRILNCGQ